MPTPVAIQRTTASDRKNMIREMRTNANKENDSIVRSMVSFSAAVSLA